MLIKEDSASAEYQIQQYEPGKIWVNKQSYQQSILIGPHLFSLINPKNLTELKLEIFDALFEKGAKPEVFLLGTGETFIIPPVTLLNYFKEKKFGFEFMDSRAACHTYMALVCEERDVMACIIV